MLIGNYGFLSDFSIRNSEVIRRRIDFMNNKFNIKEFQFYDWFLDYSTPFGEKEVWLDPFFNKRKIYKESIKLQINSIHARGGRAWAYIQSIGSMKSDIHKRCKGIFPIIKNNKERLKHPKSNERFWGYFLNSKWAKYQTKIWAESVKSLGFAGIHWDTFGVQADHYACEECSIFEFIKEAKSFLDKFDLKQTINMVDLAWWNKEVLSDYLEFPYVEVWSVEKEYEYYKKIKQLSIKGDIPEGVLVFYPSIDIPKGKDESYVLIQRWRKAESEKLSYLLVGDGKKRLYNEYFPNNVDLTINETEKIGI